MKPPGEKAMTVAELLVIIAIIAILASLSLVNPGGGLTNGRIPQTLSNMKQLHLATQQMALDASTTSETNLGWPGDTGGTFSNWTAQILNSNFLTAEDLSRLLSAPGIVLKSGKVPTTNTTAVMVYAVKEKSEGNAVFLSTANFTNTPIGGLPPLADAKPYGTNGFVVFRKAGDGAILRPKQAGDTNLIGGFVPLLK